MLDAMGADARSILTTRLTDSMLAARTCLDVTDHEIALAMALRGAEGLEAVPPEAIVQLSNATVALEESLRHVLFHLAPGSSRSLTLLTQLCIGAREVDDQPARSNKSYRGSELEGRLIRFPTRPVRPSAS